MEPISSLSIPRFEISTGPSSHVVYVIECKGPVRSWSISHRYSDFEALAKTLNLIGLTSTQIPPKNIFGFASNARLEERREALEIYLHGILYSNESKHRNHAAWQDFFNLPKSARNAEGSSNHSFQPAQDVDEANSPFSIQEWISEFDSLRNALQMIRAVLHQSNGEQGTQSNSTSARKAVRNARARYLKLENSLNMHLELHTAERSRRSCLLLNLKAELDNYELHAQSNGFQNATGIHNRLDLLEKNERVKSSRKFGVATETAETRMLDNQGLVKLQQQKTKDQGVVLAQLSSVVRRQREIGLAMQQELDSQNALLGDLEHDMSRVETHISRQQKKVKNILK